MQIITIFQGASTGGLELADAVAQSIGYGCIDREVLAQACLQYKIPEAKLAAIVDREPTWWTSFIRNQAPYRIALQAAFCQLADDQGIVYHGHLGHLLIPKFKHVVRVLLTAPIETRIGQIVERERVSEAAARRYVEEVDKARSRRLMGLFGKDWRDPSLYDIVVNLGYMSLQTARKMIVAIAHAPEYQPSAESAQAFADFALASRVHASLSLGGELSNYHFNITARTGMITVSGIIPDWMTQAYIIDEIRKIAGVTEVRSTLTLLRSTMGIDT